MQVGAGKVGLMAVNLSSRQQVTAHYYWNRRNAAALSHHGVRPQYDPEQGRSAAPILGFTLNTARVGADVHPVVVQTGGPGRSWVSDQGVRYGIDLPEDSLWALGTSPANAAEAPWPQIRMFAPRLVLS